MLDFPKIALLQKVGTTEKVRVYLNGNCYIGKGVDIPLTWWDSRSGSFRDPFIDGLRWELLAVRVIF